MSEPLPGIGFGSQYEASLASPEVRRAFHGLGTPMAVAAENLRAVAMFFDPAKFDAQIAVHRPKLWKQMNRRPARVRRWLRKGMTST